MPRRNAVRRNVRNVRRITRSIGRQTHGFRIVPTADPPAYCPGPWWPMTVVMQASIDKDLVADDIYTALLAQLGWTGHVKDKNSIPIELRMVSVRSWGLGRKPHQLCVYDSLGTKSRIAEMTDYGTTINYSRNGWKFGTLTTNDAVETNDTNVILEVTGASSDNKVLLYLQVLFRTKDAAKPVALTGLFDRDSRSEYTLKGMEL